MPRYALKIEYSGAPFSGWQRQKDRPSVQQAVEDALRMLDPDVPTIGAAGRTDAGVHALAQVAHCDMARDWDSFRFLPAVNQHIKHLPVSIVEIARVADDFHARYAAKERRYMFRLVTRRAPVTHDEGLVWQARGPLNVEAMRLGAAQLIGTHDFTTFRSTMCQAKSPMKTLDAIEIEEHPYPYGREYRFFVRSRSFLHNQVRSIVGTLERVGAGKWTPDDVGDALAACDRTACGPVCPPHGLYLAGVGYDPDPFEAARAPG
jgi:tRNA pseudouridine38-40 synthase